MKIKRALFAVRGRLASDPELKFVKGKTCCDFTVAYNLHDKHDKVLWFKFTAWDDPEKGGHLASDIAQNFKKGEWIGVTKSMPRWDAHRCKACKALNPSMAFTAYEIDGMDMMELEDLPDRTSDNMLSDEEITMILEDDNVPY